jgi:glycosyltransferase involved in cell wall biosynthesis
MVLCVSGYVRNLFKPEDQKATGRILTLYDLYSRTQKGRDAAMTEAQRNAPVICVARLEEQKGQTILLEALAYLRGNGIERRAQFVGSPRAGSDYGARLGQRAIELGVSDLVEWIGEVPDPIGLVRAASVLVLPAREEALGRVVFEAWDAGTVPIAWSGSGGPAEVIEASGGGLLYESQTGESLAQSIEHALALSNEERSAYVARGRAWIESNTDPDRYAAEMNRVFEMLRSPDSHVSRTA